MTFRSKYEICHFLSLKNAPVLGHQFSCIFEDLKMNNVLLKMTRFCIVFLSLLLLFCFDIFRWHNFQCINKVTWGFCCDDFLGTDDFGQILLLLFWMVQGVSKYFQNYLPEKMQPTHVFLQGRVTFDAISFYSFTIWLCIHIKSFWGIETYTESFNNSIQIPKKMWAAW